MILATWNDLFRFSSQLLDFGTDQQLAAKVGTRSQDGKTVRAYSVCAL